MFVPLSGDRQVVIVAPPEQPAEGFDPSSIASFLTNGRQTFIFHPGTWHIEVTMTGFSGTLGFHILAGLS